MMIKVATDMRRAAHRNTSKKVIYLIFNTCCKKKRAVDIDLFKSKNQKKWFYNFIFIFLHECRLAKLLAVAKSFICDVIPFSLALQGI